MVFALVDELFATIVASIVAFILRVVTPAHHSQKTSTLACEHVGGVGQTQVETWITHTHTHTRQRIRSKR